MTDLTKITTPFGLLDEATQNALLAHGGPYEVWSHGARWVETAVPPKDADAFVWRVKPQPPKPCEWWAGFVGELHMGMWPTVAEAHDAMRECASSYRLVRVREVLE